MHKLLICVVIGVLLSMLPTPEALNPKAWYLFSIFIATITGIILRPFPMGAISLMGLCVAIFTNTLNVQTEALNGFSNPIIWLIIMVFFLSRGFIKTHLASRIAYYFVSLFGKHTLSLGYGMTLSEILIAPCVPSNAARAGGIVSPIIRSIAEALGSTPELGTKRKVGSYLMQVGFHSNVISSAMFLTACAANPIAQSFALEQGINITWGNWFLAALLPGVLSVIIMPFVLYKLYPPQQKHLPEAISFATQKLEELGRVSVKEKYMLAVFILMLGLWIFEKQIGINPTTVAFLGVSLCLVTKILTIEDIMQEKEAWHTFIWVSILITMSAGLQKFGFIAWIANHLGSAVSGFSGITVLILLSLAYFYMHYFMAGNVTQVSAVYPAFLAVSVMAGAPPLLSALLLGFFSSLYSCTTHYGTAAAPIYFSAGYTPIKTWWKIGFIMSLIYIFIWVVMGMIWWKVLGLY